jgi:uncharacterized phage protein (TIGR02218 family)
MKTASPSLVTLLNSSSQFLMADLFTITLRAGEVVRFTSHDMDIVSGGNTFSSRGPIIHRGRTRCVTGLEVDTLDLTIAPTSTTLLNNTPFVAAAVAGALDGATLLLQRAFLSDWSQPVVGSVTLFSGRVADIDCTRSEVKITVKSDIELLNIKMPRVLFEPSCSKVLYSPSCGVNKAAFTTTGVAITSASTRSVINTAISPPNPHYYDLGTATFTSGANAGITRSIKEQVGGQLTFAFPFPYQPAVGDLMTLVPGCSKTRNFFGCSKFNNLLRFRGFPFVPAPETVT